MSTFDAPTAREFVEWSLRFLHVLFGITWIGLLYFFNLVNGQVMAKLDGPTKGKVVPVLMPRALWFFRWGALGTWLVGFVYFALLLTSFQMKHVFLASWLVMTLAFYAAVYFVLSPKAGLQKNGNAIAAILSVIVIVYCLVIRWMNVAYTGEGGALNAHLLFIGYGGGIGTFMFLNVWGIIWRNQKRIIAWTAANAESGTAIPPESAVLARQAFLASRTNTWMSLPMLACMILAGHGKVFFH